MHQVLHLPEILYNIFGHLAPTGDWEWVGDRLPYTRDLAVLARTCRTFKEPALDVLWSELPELSIIARCVPDATYSPKSYYYAFKRPLTEAEWATLRSYARRVWIFVNCTFMEACLEEESVEMLFNSTDGALFPNLRFLSWYYARPVPLVHVAVQPLRTLHLDFKHAEPPEYRDILDSAGSLCLLIKRFRLHMPRQYVEHDNIVSGHVLRWSNIQVLECREVALSSDAILHISRMPTLVHLVFILNKDIPNRILPSDFVLVFSNLSWCEISSGWLLPVAELLTRVRLPALKELIVKFPGSPSKQALRSFMMALRNACSADTLTHICVQRQRYLLDRLCACGDAGLDNYPLAYDDLYPCTAFGNLRSLNVSLAQSINLTDDDLVELASAWPHLEELFINDDSGWRAPGGITFTGLVRLFRTCPSLHSFALLLDTPTFACIPEGMHVSYPPRALHQVNLADTPLQPAMIAGVVNAFVAIRLSPRLLNAWIRPGMDVMPHETRKAWQEVDAEVKARLAVIDGPKEGTDGMDPGHVLSVVGF